jgi:hypothetical protein
VLTGGRWFGLGHKARLSNLHRIICGNSLPSNRSAAARTCGYLRPPLNRQHLRDLVVAVAFFIEYKAQVRSGGHAIVLLFLN